MKISFAKNGNWREKMRLAYMLRFGAKSDFIQEEDAVADPVNEAISADYANDSFSSSYAYVGALTHDTYTDGTEVELRCSFEGSGAPMIMLTDDCTLDKDGDAHYGSCVEVVIWKYGMNVWRHKHCGQRGGYRHLMSAFPALAENEIHDLRIKVVDKMLLIKLDGMSYSVYIPDMPEKFWIGAAVCEGENRLYDLKINENNSFEGFFVWDAFDYPIYEVER